MEQSTGTTSTKYGYDRNEVQLCHRQSTVLFHAAHAYRFAQVLPSAELCIFLSDLFNLYVAIIMKEKLKKKWRWAVACACCVWASGLSARPAPSVPDSVYLFPYATQWDAGRSGLKFAWSPDRQHWFSVGNDYGYVKCDYAAWGVDKRMIRPELYRDHASGMWHCVWQLNGNGQEFAHAASSNLLDWGSQSYFTLEQYGRFVSDAWQKYPLHTLEWNGVKQEGSMQRVAWTDVERLNRYADHRAYRSSLYDERMEQDAVRFAGLAPVRMQVKADPTQAKPISDHLFGVFFEDINYGADGGLYAELIQNRDFEYNAADHSGWSATTAWTLEGDGGSTLSVDTVRPIHPNNPHYAVLDVRQPGASLVNAGYDGIVLRQGEKYDFAWMARSAGDGKGGKVRVCLLDKDGKELASETFRVSGTEWKKQTAVLRPQADADAAVLAICPEEAGTYAFDMVSLFPRNTFHGRKNGLRADLAQAIADLHPRFVRFPGGCVAHGNGIDNIYRWKNSIGPLEARKPMRNLWGYHQSMGLGYFEYFQFCEDVGAEPLPVVAAGVPCQNSACREGVPLSGGQQGGIAMDEMDAYVQDILDLIDYANGDPKNNRWARMRAEAGHPEPFNLKFIGIGNEDLITDVFAERFTLLYNAVKERHPEITVIGTVGPFYEGTDYEEGWKLATRLKVPVVDEHYYNTPGWFIHNQDYYDRYDRSKPQVYLGEYAAHVPDRSSNMETALAEAIYLTSVERNGDLVTMTSYAPLLGKEGHTQWRPDLIYFTNTEVSPTTSYYVQQLYGQNAGDSYLPVRMQTDSGRNDVDNRIAVSVVKDSRSNDVIVKLVNLLPVEVDADIDLAGAVLAEGTAALVVLQGYPDDCDVQPVQSTVDAGSQFAYTLPPYSFSVIRVKAAIE